MKLVLAAGGLIVVTIAGAVVVSVHAQEVKQLDPNVKLFIPYQQYSPEDNQRVLALFDGLRVADVSDGMDMAGLTDVGTVDPEIRALWTDTQNFTHRIIGIAVTARYVPTNKRVGRIDQKTINEWYANITSEAFQPMLFPGAILVIDAAEATACVSWASIRPRSTRSPRAGDRSSSTSTASARRLRASPPASSRARRSRS